MENFSHLVVSGERIDPRPHEEAHPGGLSPVVGLGSRIWESVGFGSSRKKSPNLTKSHRMCHRFFCEDDMTFGPNFIENVLTQEMFFFASGRKERVVHITGRETVRDADETTGGRPVGVSCHIYRRCQRGTSMEIPELQFSWEKPWKNTHFFVGIFRAFLESIFDSYRRAVC